MSKFLFLHFILLSFALTASAQGVSNQDTGHWVEPLREGMPWEKNNNHRRNNELLLPQLEQELRESPNSKELQRDLGDVLHTLGHFAEYDMNFELALSYHQRSLNMFILSGEKSATAWDDGVGHAYEHIFMATYDKAVLLLREGNTQDSIRWFVRAFSQFGESPGIYQQLRKRKHIARRETSFVRTQPSEIQSTINQILQSRGYKAVQYRCETLFL